MAYQPRGGGIPVQRQGGRVEWRRYDRCPKCEVPAGAICQMVFRTPGGGKKYDYRNGNPLSKPHKERPVL